MFNLKQKKLITLYIKGRDGFKEAVLKKLDYLWLFGNSDVEHQLIMFWLTDLSQLDNFKLSIGSKLIFRYRLHFFTNLEEHLELEIKKVSPGFSVAEKKMIFDMTSLESSQRKTRRFKSQAALQIK